MQPVDALHMCNQKGSLAHAYVLWFDGVQTWYTFKCTRKTCSFMLQI